MDHAKFYVRRSDQVSTRGPFRLEDGPRPSAVKVMAQYQADAPKDATLTIEREDGSAFRTYRWTLADDGYWGWHSQD